MAFLMCLDTAVYCTRTKKVLNAKLMPCPQEHYEEWRNSRMFLRGINRRPEQDEMELGADSITVKRRLSLSDSYWIKYNKDTVKSFSEITPYTNDFFEYGVCASRKSSPSLTLTGSLNKYWKRVGKHTAFQKVMWPEWASAECKAVQLAKQLGLAVNEVEQSGESVITVYNFTSPGVMLMRLQPWDLQVSSMKEVSSDFGYNLMKLDKVYKRLGIVGNFHIITALFDAVVSNHDRLTNLSNWGYFKSGVDGRNKHCPMFDFNLAHPEQDNQYLHIMKKQMNVSTKQVLQIWRPVVEAFGDEAWLRNLDGMLRV